MILKMMSKPCNIFFTYTLSLCFVFVCLCIYLIGVLSQISLNLHLGLDSSEHHPLTCTFQAGSVDLCSRSNPVAHLPNCSCSFPEKLLSSNGHYFHSIFYLILLGCFMIMCME